MFKKKSYYLLSYLLIIVLLLFGGVYFIAPVYKFICDSGEYVNIFFRIFSDFYMFDNIFKSTEDIILKINFYVTVSDDLP